MGGLQAEGADSRAPALVDVAEQLGLTTAEPGLALAAPAKPAEAMFGTLGTSRPAMVAVEWQLAQR